ncbi:divalent-cation tolerance protein CutA [Thauera sp.]|jgi:periplasmic divalent cation tolerance protein|uniref:divalent-cation tolerance protein CutA n=1 Tax=Thauera sp. TaxID=1905334 RepID=UPI002A3710C6|nr:divalent-cation tolerance protein CutA [Thauera sp.]MDX9885913.1 divalent-cation tolerance protein CutA [Thauera sp.]
MSATAPTRPDDSRALLVFTNMPDHDSATALAAALVEARLVACVNVLAACTSVYRWQGVVETASEVPVLMKTTLARYAALEAAIRARHPYELPEIVAVPVERGLPAYLDWVAAETGG